MGGKYLIWIGIALVIVILFFTFTTKRAASFEKLESFEGEIKIYKSNSCGCCGVYSNYFKNNGNSKAEVVNTDNLEMLKKQHEIPKEMESCHTTIIGDYFVEGHVPLEAVEKLINEKPDIAGIALPGMPMGSPGMTGVKLNDFVIYAVHHNKSYSEFMRI